MCPRGTGDLESDERAERCSNCGTQRADERPGGHSSASKTRHYRARGRRTHRYYRRRK
jgi:hypothetical protein